jgi:hypothetical protein
MYLKSEYTGTSEVDRKAIFDLYSENEREEKVYCRVAKD